MDANQVSSFKMAAEEMEPQTLQSLQILNSFR